MLIFIITLLLNPIVNPKYPTHGMGAKFTPEKIAKKYLIPKEKLKKLSESTLPDKVDLCDQLPEVRTQGAQGSCVAWAVGYYYKTFQEAKEHNWDVNDEEHICSPSFVYNFINSGNDNGSFPIDAASLIRTAGCTSWKDMPYNDDDNETIPSIEKQKNALKFRSKGFGVFYYRSNNASTGKRYKPVSDDALKAMKAHLLSGDALVISIPIYDNFHRNYSGFYHINKDATVKMHGGHALVVCGYDDNAGDGKGGFRIKNSWGTDWGKDGLSYLSYEFMKYFSGEAIYMVDRKDYQPKVIAEVKLDDVPRSQVNFIALGEEGHSPIVDYLSGDFRKGFEQVLDLTDINVDSYRNYYFNFMDYYADGKKGTLDYIKIKKYNGDLIHEMNGLNIEMPDQGDIDVLPGGFKTLHYDKNGYDYSVYGKKEDKSGYLGVEFTFLEDSRVWGIDFFNNHDNSKYSLAIYNSKDDFLSKKEALFTKEGELFSKGWYSIKVDKYITVKNEKKLFIVIKYENENGEVIPIDSFPPDKDKRHSYFSLDGTGELVELEYNGKIRVRLQDYSMFEIEKVNLKIKGKEVTIEPITSEKIVSTKLDCDNDGIFEKDGLICSFKDYGKNLFYVKFINDKDEWNISKVEFEIIKPKPKEPKNCSYSNNSSNTLFLSIFFFIVLFIRRKKSL